MRDRRLVGSEELLGLVMLALWDNWGGIKLVDRRPRWRRTGGGEVPNICVQEVRTGTLAYPY